MATGSASKSVDIQEFITAAAEAEMKAIANAVEYWRVWIGQAAKLTEIADDTLRAIKSKKGSAAVTVRRLAEFGEKNADVFGDLYGRMTKSYYDEVGRLTAFVESKGKRATASKGAQRKPARKKKARRGA